MAADKPDKPQTGRLVDAWVGDKPRRKTFRDYLTHYRRRYERRSGGFDAVGRVGPVGPVDPVAAYRAERLTDRDRARFAPFARELAMLGYDLDTEEGIDRFWRLGAAEQNRLYYAVQNPRQFKARVQAEFFEAFRSQFDDFQARFNQFFETFKETEPSFDPEDIETHQKFMNLDRAADRAAIKERYRLLALRYHPDHGGDEERMKALNIAYAALMRRAAG